MTGYVFLFQSQYILSYLFKKIYQIMMLIRKQILVVTQNKEFAISLSARLDLVGLNVQACLRADQAVRFLDRNYATLVVMDANLPDKSGLELLETLRSSRLIVPVIMLLENGVDEAQTLRAFSLGADDVMIHPVSQAELIARIQAVLRRTESSQTTSTASIFAVDAEPFGFSGVMVHPQRMEIEFSNGAREKIGKKELGILAYLVANPGVVLTRRSLIHSVWGAHADVRSRSLDQYIVRLRDMFNRHNMEMSAFRTIHGVGYIYDPQLSIVG
jgi:DNA-binding response OmpR family regulator